MIETSRIYLVGFSGTGKSSVGRRVARFLGWEFIDTDERIALFQEAVAGVDNITVMPFSGMAVQFAARIGSTVLVRGLRIGLDFEHEREMALVWRKLAPEIEVVMLTSSLINQYVSSTRVKEIASLDADVSSFVPAHVEKALLERLAQTD